ncbi:ABC transporter substrate-binding protein [Glycomyces sp. NPDC048151]|uniref:ABC transporter substrate-binding protein n=1 Tax=Glycomyces sp. NPDC048151 TaxID=3364002 RepID=UPI0037123B0C
MPDRKPPRRAARLDLSPAPSLSRRRFVCIAATTAVGGALAACGEEETPLPENTIDVGAVPDYYPAEYAQLIAAAEAEGGEFTIYSNTDQENWAPVFRDFQKKYEWVKDIAANNLDSDEVFQRVLSEQATGGSPADLVVSNAAQAWAEFAAEDGRLLEYASPELEQLPEFAQLLPSVYAMSTDPMVIAYNASLIPEKPKGIAHLAEIVAADPDAFAEKITARDVEGAFGFTVSHAFTEADPAAWDALGQILPLARPETSSGTQNDKILAGEYLVGFFISAAPAYPLVEDSAGLFEVVFPEDGTVVLPRGAGIASGAPHPNTAKLFIDFLLSEEGQRAVAEGGLTSYRDSVDQVEGLHTYQEVVAAVGEEGVVFAEYVEVNETDAAEFTTRWNSLLDS